MDDDAFCMMGWAKAASLNHDVTVHLPPTCLWWMLRCYLYHLTTADHQQEYDGVVFLPYPADTFPPARATVGCIVEHREGDLLHEYDDDRYDRYACLTRSAAILRGSKAEVIPWAIDFDLFANDGNSWHKGRKPTAAPVTCEGQQPEKPCRLVDIAKEYEFLPLDFESDGQLVLAHEGPAFGSLPMCYYGHAEYAPNPSTILQPDKLVGRHIQQTEEYYAERPDILAQEQRRARGYAFALHSHRKVYDELERLIRKLRGR